MITPANKRWYNFPAMVAMGNPGGYANFMDGRWSRYLNRSQRYDLDRFFAIERLRRGSVLLRHLGPKYLLTTEPLERGRNSSASGYGWFKLHKSFDDLYLYRDPEAAPRAALVHRVETIEDEEAAYRRMEQPDFDIRKVVLLEDQLPSGFTAPQSPATEAEERAEITLYQPNRVEIAVEAAAPAVLVLSDTLHPGWQATVDGRPVPIVHANRVMRAMPVPAGRHTVVMTYLPNAFVTGAAVSLTTVLLIVAAFWVTHRRRGAPAG
jgi:hypothetical protein